MSGRNSKTVDERRAARIDELVRAARDEAPPPTLARHALDRLAAVAPVNAPPDSSPSAKRSPTLAIAKAALIVSTLCLGVFAVEKVRLPDEGRSSSAPTPSAATPGANAFPAAEAVAERAPPSPPDEQPSGDALEVHQLPSATADVADAPRQRAIATASERRTTAPKVTAPSVGTAPADTFALELARLREARTALAAGRVDEASSILAHYEESFPNGVLLPEAKAMRVDVLLAAGHVDEARSEAEGFIVRYPNSPQAGRMRVLVERRTVR